MSSRMSRMYGAANPDATSNAGNESYSRIFRYFGLHENPFNVSADPRYLSFTRRSQEAFDSIVYGIQSRQGLIVLTGEVGTGKTTLTKYLLNWLAERQTPTAYICNPRLSSSDLLDFLFADFGITLPTRMKGDKSAMLTGWLVAQNRAGKRPVLIVDEAQGLPLPVLEQIRLLLNLETANEKLLQVILVGQPELEQTLNRTELVALRQRIMVRCRIGSLNSHETRAYILRRLRVAGAHGESAFTPEAMESVFEYSCGIPRVINNLCEHSMINAYADGVPRISAEIVREVARDFDLDKIKPLGAGLGFRGFEIDRPEPDPAEPDRSEVDQSSIEDALAASFVSASRPAFPPSPFEPAAEAPEQIQEEEMAMPGPVLEEAFSLPSAPIRSSMGGGLAKETDEIQMVDANAWLRSALSTWRRWRELDLVELSFPKIQRAASSVVRWLVEPVDPLNPWNTNRQNHRTPSRSGHRISAT
ncbi:MAG TPA: AAA family ATPase [Candidatus Acidoferrales bacterium]|nr:AAA family ATPase [Candidatus Acidoferrales bacterium]